MITPLDAALAYAERGYPVFPCSPNTKVPFARTNGCKDATTDEATIRKWWESAPTANVAIATGSVSGIYVVDVDVVSSEVMPLLPTTWTARTRGGGWHYIYTLPDGVTLPNTAKKSPNAVHGDADTRGEGGYILVFPSVIDGKQYQWVNDIEPATLPQWIVDRVRPKTETRMATRQMFLMVSSSWAQKALDEECAIVSSTPKGGRHAVLVRASFKIGQIVAGGHLSASSAESYLIRSLDAFSLPDADYRHALKTIDQCMRAGMASPRHPERRERSDPFHGEEITCEVLPAVTPARPPKPDTDAERWALLNDVRSLGGLCDSFSAWVIRGADHPQPGLTIGALVALGSVMAGRRLVFRRSLSSIYLVAMANSAEGKNRPQSCLSRVIDEVWPGLAGPNSFSSGPAFTDNVRKAVNMGTGTVLVLDEYGMQLANMMGPRASSHRQDIKQSLTELATKGTDKWSPALSLVKGGGKLELWAPSVTILGSTTPESLHAVLTSTDVADGFVGRHVWCRAQDVLPLWQPPDTRGDDGIPIDVRSAVMVLRERHEQWNMALPVQNGTGIDEIRLYDPCHMPETPEADQALTAHKFKCDEDRRTGKRLDIPRAVLGRAPEFASRMAMILAVLAQPEESCPTVGLDHVRVAIALADESAKVFAASLAANQRPDWNDPEAQCEYVLSAIRRSGGSMAKGDMSRACRRLTSRTIDDTITRLVEEEAIVVFKEASEGGRAKEVLMLNEPTKQFI
jgi:hypothetical protein